MLWSSFFAQIVITKGLFTNVYNMLASSTGPFPAFQCCMLKTGRAWCQKSHDRFYPYEGWWKGEMNMGEPKISKVQGPAIHDLLEVRLRSYRVIVASTIVLDYRE